MYACRHSIVFVFAFVSNVGFVFVCVYTIIHTYIHTKIQTFIHTDSRIDSHTDSHIYSHIHSHTFAYAYMGDGGGTLAPPGGPPRRLRAPLGHPRARLLPPAGRRRGGPPVDRRGEREAALRHGGAAGGDGALHPGAPGSRWCTPRGRGKRVSGSRGPGLANRRPVLAPHVAFIWSGLTHICVACASPEFMRRTSKWAEGSDVARRLRPTGRHAQRSGARLASGRTGDFVFLKMSLCSRFSVLAKFLVQVVFLGPRRHWAHWHRIWSKSGPLGHPGPN